MLWPGMGALTFHFFPILGQASTIRSLQSLSTIHGVTVGGAAALRQKRQLNSKQISFLHFQRACNWIPDWITPTVMS